MAVSFIAGGNHRPVTSHWQTLSHNIVSSTPRLSEIRTHNISYKSNYRRITTTTAPYTFWPATYIWQYLLYHVIILIYIGHMSHTIWKYANLCCLGSIAYFAVFFCVRWFRVIVDCSFCPYWWNYSPSLFKLSFHNWNNYCVIYMHTFQKYDI